MTTTLKALEALLGYALLVVAALYVLNQVRKPTKWVGRFFLWIVNASHSNVTDWGLRHVRIEKDATVLDVGCCGGRTIQKLAAIATEGMVYDLDYANGSVAASRAKNAKLMQMGRVEIEQASVSQLPFLENKFSLVTAVETQYYWPELLKNMREILRVLRPSGTLIIIAESYKNGAYDKLQRPVMKPLRSANLGVDEQRALFSTAGYTDIQIFEERSKGWICVIGKKPVIVSYPTGGPSRKKIACSLTRPPLDLRTDSR